MLMGLDKAFLCLFFLTVCGIDSYEKTDKIKANKYDACRHCISQCEQGLGHYSWSIAEGQVHANIAAQL